MALVSTKQAAAETGLSERELRRGYYAGIYPGIGIGEKGGRLRFDPQRVLQAINEQKESSEVLTCKQKFKVG